MERRAIDTPTTQAGKPVLKARNVGSRFKGALALSPEMREQRDDNGVKLKPDGSPKRELVMHLLCVEADCAAGSLDNPVDVIPGEVYRFIMKGKTWGEWIEATKNQNVRIGDSVALSWDHAQAYDQSGNPQGPALTDPNEVTRLKQGGKSVGIYPTVTYADDLPDHVIGAAMAFEDEYKAAQVEAARNPVDNDPFPTSTNPAYTASSPSW